MTAVLGAPVSFVNVFNVVPVDEVLAIVKVGLRFASVPNCVPITTVTAAGVPVVTTWISISSPCATLKECVLSAQLVAETPEIVQVRVCGAPPSAQVNTAETPIPNAALS